MTKKRIKWKITRKCERKEMARRKKKMTIMLATVATAAAVVVL